MPILKNVLGLDLGSHTVKAVEVQQGLRGFEGVQIRQVPRDADGLALSALVQRLVELHHLPTDNVVTALRGDRLSNRPLSFPFRERRRLAQAIPFEIEDQLPFDFEDVLLDWEMARSDRNHADVLVVVAGRSEVSQLLSTLQEAGCEPRTVEAEGIVLANLTAAFDLPGNRLLVDVGHEKTTLCALAEGRPVGARSFAVAGRHITEALAQDRALSLADAERAKCEEGIVDGTLGVPLPKAAAVVDHIATELVRTLASLEPVLAGGVHEVTLMGGTALLDRFDDLLAERTSLPVARIGLPREQDGKGLVAGGSPVLFAPAIALALRGTTRATTEVNFRQDEFARRVDLGRYRRDFGTTGIMAAVVAVLALVWLASGAMVESRRAGGAEEQVAALYRQTFPDQPVPGDPIRAVRESVREANERAEFLGVYRGNLSALDLLAEISRHIPEDLEIVFEELSIDRQTVRIRVFSKSFEAADRIGAELSKFGPFGQAQIGAIETDKRTGGKKFTVTISLSSEQPS